MNTRSDGVKQGNWDRGDWYYLLDLAYFAMMATVSKSCQKACLDMEERISKNVGEMENDKHPEQRLENRQDSSTAQLMVVNCEMRLEQARIMANQKKMEIKITSVTGIEKVSPVAYK